MTLVAGWVNMERPEFPEIWAVADSSITDNDKTLTDIGSKVMSIPITCKALPDRGQRDVYLNSCIGFAYAGSSLAGLNVYASLGTLLGNIGSRTKSLPEYTSLIGLVKQVVSLYTRSVQSVVEVLVYGFCPRSKQPFMGTIKPRIQDGEIEFITETRYGIPNELNCLFLGNPQGIEALKDWISTYSYLGQTSTILPYWRAPANGIKTIIKDQSFFPEIGGDLQIGIINKEYFEHVFSMKKSEGGDLRAVFRNIDLIDELPYVIGNDCYVSMNGLII